MDAVNYAAQLGRLDFISALLAAIGLALVLSGIFAFFHFKSEAKKAAEAVAIASIDDAVSKYLEKNMLSVIEKVRDMERGDKGVYYESALNDIFPEEVSK